jgi:hypothetical protein
LPRISDQEAHLTVLCRPSSASISESGELWCGVLFSGQGPAWVTGRGYSTTSDLAHRGVKALVGSPGPPPVRAA